MSTGQAGDWLEVPLSDEIQEPTQLVLHYTRGGQTFRVHVSRADIDNFAQQRLPRATQNQLIRTNRATLAPIIEGKVVSGETGQWTNPVSGQAIPLIELTHADLEQGLRRYQIGADFRRAAELLTSPPSGRTAIDDTPSEPGQPPPPFFTNQNMDPPQPEIQLSAATRLSPVTGRATLTIKPATLPTLSQQDRAELDGRLVAVEAQFKGLLPVVETLEKLAPAPPGPGHNNPPDDEPPISSGDIELGAAAIATMRIELSLEAQRVDVFDLVGKALGTAARAVRAFSKWIAERTTVYVDALLKELGKRSAQVFSLAALLALLHSLPIDLVRLATTILGHIP